MIEGIFPVHKVVGPTSHDVVREFQRICGQRRVGHAGTLDPLASGVLIVGAGRSATKQLPQILQGDKEYKASIRLGANSVTDDAEGTKCRCLVTVPPTMDQVRSVLARFIGYIQQTPPAYSAVKIKGRCAYDYARKNQTVELKPRTVHVVDLEMLSYHWPDLIVRVVTGSGVYVRALARDIGRQLTTGGYITSLIRTRVGEYTLARALTLEQWREQFGTER